MKVHFKCKLPYTTKSDVACGKWNPRKLTKTTLIEDVTCGSCLRSDALWQAADLQGKIIIVPAEPPAGFGGAGISQ